ncbi:MAG: DUF3137 domain-containing protein [Ferruginibacter sp.]
MQTYPDFETYYKEQVEPHLPEIHAQHDDVNNWGIAAMVTGSFCVFFLFALMSGHFQHLGWSSLTIGIIFTIFSIYKYTANKDQYDAAFKNKIIAGIFNFLHPGLTYLPDEKVPSNFYKASSLFRNRHVYYDGSDFVSGVYKGVNFQCSDIHAQSENHKGNTSTVFKGLFFVADVNPFYTGGTYIWPKADEQLPTSLADEQYRLYPMPPVYKITIGDIESEKKYSVYSTDPYDGGAVLQHGILSALNEFSDTIGREVRLSIVAGKCYVSIAIEEDLFESTKDPANPEAVKQYFFSALLILSIINQLKLNMLQ